MTIRSALFFVVAAKVIVGCGGEADAPPRPAEVPLATAVPKAPPTPPVTASVSAAPVESTTSTLPNPERAAECASAAKRQTLPRAGEFTLDPGAPIIIAAESVGAYESTYTIQENGTSTYVRALSLRFWGPPLESVDHEHGWCWTTGYVDWSLVESRSTSSVPEPTRSGEYPNVTVGMGDTSSTCCEDRSGTGVGGAGSIPEVTIVITERTDTMLEGSIKTSSDAAVPLLRFRAPFLP